MDNKKKLRIIGVLLVSLGGFILLSLLFFILSNSPEKNIADVTHKMGFVGGLISRLLFKQTIGYACFIFPLLIISWGVNFILSNKILALKKITIYALLFSLYLSIGLALIGIIKNTSIDLDSQQWGKIGGLIGAQCFSWVGAAGSIIFFPTIVFITLIYAIDIKFGKIKSKLTRWMVIIIAFIFRKYDRRLFKPNQPTPGLKMLFLKTKGEEKEKKDFPTIKIPASTPDDKFEPEELIFKERGDRKDFISNITDGSEQPESRPEMELGKFPKPHPTRKYLFPEPLLLDEPTEAEDEVSWDDLMSSAKILEEKLADFGIEGKVVEINPGPIITRFEIEPAAGVKISRFTSLSDDLAMAMRAKNFYQIRRISFTITNNISPTMSTIPIC